MSYLLDTCVVSELRKPRPHRGVVAWIASTPDDLLHLSVLTIGELRLGEHLVRSRGDARQADAIRRWIDITAASYSARLASVDAETAAVWGRLAAVRPMPVVDGLLAATALRFGWTLVTRNVHDVAHTGVPVLDPFHEREQRR